MILYGEKVGLRPMGVNEIPLFCEWATQSEAAIYWYGDGKIDGYQVPSYQEFSGDWQSYYFDGSQPERGRCFMILVNEHPIGQINYNRIDRTDDSVELDILIAGSENKNKGYGPDALQTLISYLFQEMNVKRCFVDVILKNTQAIRAYQKAGLKTSKTFVDNGIPCQRMEIEK